ncbi:hypothetical protein [Natrinema longum]|uniref:DUF4352 domain-containing protein n=1 Tax=Natrinema longum TaxID=370324 RepID=A0A8A2UDN4_9EURY|nr:hypothetical protein [Natrinema longum]MBZ6495169.1 hypothetical protein [Natrinema longum]QSW86849.1 hypothetical protein J0X27_08570 [Natrinema longum]
MDRRRYLEGCVGIASLAAGCSGLGPTETGSNGNGNSSEGPTGDDTGNAGSDGDSPTENALRIGRWGLVTERTATRPSSVRLVDRVVFDRFDDDDVVWTPDRGSQYCFVRIDLKVLEAPDGELVAYPDPYEYRVRADGRPVHPRSAPERTGAVVEPIRAGYAVGQGSGAEGVVSHNALAFEVPDDVTPADLRIEYEDDANGETLIWAPDEALEE